MKETLFHAKNGLVLKVAHRKSAVEFHLESPNIESRNLDFHFTPAVFNKLLDYILVVANESWSNPSPQDANSPGSDYWEYYDKKLDNNGYLSIDFIGNTLSLSRPVDKYNKLYQFNKRKMESFMFDISTKRCIC
ncbi:hypothetical protein HCJ66_01130 [Listeria sp. FSL L7-1582]|uniref:hypothetical protein n=1 Tax=Listeria portnoyi TaxID=2713504 RepID=UPI00164ECE55|nr:hypothetical protein [Listeria portnoyi]MBC6308145.1 hypothetical protein [Listeria portnoyi]